MRKIGECVLYGVAGVMTIVDIREESIGDVSRKYYVLRSARSRSESLTFVPADNERLVGAMRPLLTREELESLAASAKDIEPLEWIEANRVRSEAFKAIMESGDRVGMIAMIKAINENGIRRGEEGRKNFLADETAKQKALKLLSREIAIVRGITDEEATIIADNLAK